MFLLWVFYRWALPPQTINVKRFIPNSETVDTQFTLSVYERNIQVINVCHKIKS